MKKGKAVATSPDCCRDQCLVQCLAGITKGLFLSLSLEPYDILPQAGPCTLYRPPSGLGRMIPAPAVPETGRARAEQRSPQETPQVPALEVHLSESLPLIPGPYLFFPLTKYIPCRGFQESSGRELISSGRENHNPLPGDPLAECPVSGSQTQGWGRGMSWEMSSHRAVIVKKFVFSFKTYSA